MSIAKIPTSGDLEKYLQPCRFFNDFVAQHTATTLRDGLQISPLILSELKRII